MAVTGRINLRCTEDRIEEYRKAATAKGMTLTDFILRTADAMAQRVVEQTAPVENRKKVHTSEPLQEVSEKVQGLPADKSQEPALHYWTHRGRQYRGRDGSDFVEYEEGGRWHREYGEAL